MGKRLKRTMGLANLSNAKYIFKHDGEKPI